MAETYSSSRVPLEASERPHCSKCDSRMILVLVARGPSGFDIRTFDCANCDHAHIVTGATDVRTALPGRAVQAKDGSEEPRYSRRFRPDQGWSILYRRPLPMGIVW